MAADALAEPEGNYQNFVKLGSHGREDPLGKLMEPMIRWTSWFEWIWGALWAAALWLHCKLPPSFFPSQVGWN